MWGEKLAHQVIGSGKVPASFVSLEDDFSLLPQLAHVIYYRSSIIPPLSSTVSGRMAYMLPS